MKKLFLPLALVAAVVFTACDDKKKDEKKEGDKKDNNTENTDASQADEAAHEVCVCMQDLMNLQEDAKIAEENQDDSTAMEIMVELETAQKEAMECVMALQQKYDKVSEQEIQAAIKKACPETAAAMF